MRKTGLSLTTITLLAGCGGGGGGGVAAAAMNFVTETLSGGNFSAGALSAAAFDSFAAFESAARDLREADPRYFLQKIDNWYVETDGVTGPTGNEQLFNSYSLAAARVEYAHAAGITGRGQTIASVDGDFLSGHE
ncbi:MAG: hypothetical protein R3197_13250, partial [Paracoccaceae bacterium]|nr:hypothetical protein [Paracoccaceae bacterium]